MMVFKRICWILSLLGLLCLPLSAAQGMPLAEPGLPLTPSWTSDGALTGSKYGAAVAINGDLNGDGYADLVIGAPKANSLEGDERTGAAYVFLGSYNPLGVVPHWTGYGSKKGVEFGSAVAWTHDVDGNLQDELLVGAPMFGDQSQMLTNQGTAILYEFAVDNAQVVLNQVWQTYGSQQEAKYGASLSSAGDVNGDGFEDMIVGSPGFDGAFNNEGAVYAYYGSASGISIVPNWMALGGRATASLGYSVAGIGDFNNDGFDDILAGANGWETETRYDAGAVMLFLGSSSGLASTPAWIFEGALNNAQLGRAVAGAGDVNQDGYADLLVGAPYYGFSGSQEGAVYLILGGLVDPLNPTPTPAWSRVGGMQNANLGASLSAAGDLNQDGFEDVVIGAPRYTDDNLEEGRVYAFYGNPDGLDLYPSWWADGDKADATFGAALSGAADLDRDSYLDLAVGAPEFRLETIIVGQAFAFYGIPDAVIPVDYSCYLPFIVVSP